MIRIGRAMRNAAGELLRERRQQLRLDLDAVAEALCIKPVYLAAIEQGRTEELPGPTYAIGFIRAYANYLGFDGERVLDSYREEKADVQTRPDLTLPVPLDERSVPGGRVLLTGLVLALCGYGTWYYVATGERERPERVAAVPAELQHLTAPPPRSRGPDSGRPDETSAVQTSAVQAGAPAPVAVTASSDSPAVPQARLAAAGASSARTVAAPQFGSGVLTQQQSAAGPVAPAGGSRRVVVAAPAPPPRRVTARRPADSRNPSPQARRRRPSGSIDIRAARRLLDPDPRRRPGDRLRARAEGGRDLPRAARRA